MVAPPRYQGRSSVLLPLPVRVAAPLTADLVDVVGWRALHCLCLGTCRATAVLHVAPVHGSGL